jgi:hypothetical protein
MSGYRLISKGFEVILECALLHPGNGMARVLSMIGTREAVRAIWARAVQGEQPLITGNGAYHHVRLKDASMRQQRLPCGSVHLLVVAKRVTDGFTLIARDQAELEDRLWASMQRHCAIPLHPNWRAFALERVRGTPLLEIGTIAGCDLGSLEDLASSVRSAVKAGELCA